MKKTYLLLTVAAFSSLSMAPPPKSIYHNGWIDFNKNGAKDIYEDPSQPVEKRLKDLLGQMTLEEKTCQLATLYGYMRVLKDELPTPEWKNAIWKDGIANIDEHLNGLKKTANQMGKGIIAFSPLAQGLLTDKYLHGIPSDSRIAVDGRFLHADALTKEKLAQIEALNKMAAERGQSLAQMALSWILKDEDVTSVLIGASRPEQIIQNVEIVQNMKFTQEELTKIDQISRGNL